MKRLAALVALVLLASLVACSNGSRDPEAVVKEFLDFHQPGLWTPAYVDHDPFLVFTASESLEQRVDAFIASRLELPPDSKFEREEFIEGLALDPFLKCEIVSVSELEDGKVDVLARVTRPNPDALNRLWGREEVIRAQVHVFLASRGLNEPEDLQKLREAKAVFKRFVERMTRTQETVKSIDEFNTSEIHFVVRLATNERGPKLLIGETWTPEGRARDDEAKRLTQHTVSVLEIQDLQYKGYDETTFIEGYAHNPSNEKTGRVYVEVELLDEKGRTLVAGTSVVDAMDSGHSDDFLVMLKGVSYSRRWRIRFAEAGQASPWRTFEGNRAVAPE
jgi:hypothetical protein